MFCAEYVIPVTCPFESLCTLTPVKTVYSTSLLYAPAVPLKVAVNSLLESAVIGV